jgi:hypothetical protein
LFAGTVYVCKRTDISVDAAKEMVMEHDEPLHMWYFGTTEPSPYSWVYMINTDVISTRLFTTVHRRLLCRLEMCSCVRPVCLCTIYEGKR